MTREFIIIGSNVWSSLKLWNPVRFAVPMPIMRLTTSMGCYHIHCVPEIAELGDLVAPIIDSSVNGYRVYFESSLFMNSLCKPSRASTLLDAKLNTWFHVLSVTQATINGKLVHTFKILLIKKMVQ